MPTPYAFRARDAQGLEQQGLSVGVSTSAVARELASRGWVPIDIQPQPTAARAATRAATQAAPQARPPAPRQAAQAAIARAAGRDADGSDSRQTRTPWSARTAAQASADMWAVTQPPDENPSPVSAALPQRAPNAPKPGVAAAASAAAVAVAAAPDSGTLNLSAWLRPSRKRVQAAFGLVLRELAALLRAGVPLMRALQLVADSASEVPVRDALQRISRDLDNGHNLVKAAEHEHRATGLFTPYDIAMLQVGEQTGRLPEALSALHSHREFTRSTNEQVAAALRYPAFVVLTCLIAMVVINIFVIPAFARVFAQARTPLPWLTLALLAGSNFMLRTWPLLLVAAAGASFGWRRWLKNPRGRLWWDRVKLRLPIVGNILQNIVLARLSASLSSSLAAGLTLTESITVTARTLDNQWFEAKLQHMCNDLARGSSITAASRNMGVLPPTMLQLFAIGEESGSLEELMREISQHYQSNVDFAVRRLSATLEPILIWLLGMGVLVLALGVFMPMWDLGRSAVR